MLAAAGGRAGVLPSGSRWLDLFAGTGSVGLEALSRGAAHCRFIELDHWVVSNVRPHTGAEGLRHTVFVNHTCLPGLRSGCSIPLRSVSVSPSCIIYVVDEPYSLYTGA